MEGMTQWLKASVPYLIVEKYSVQSEAVWIQPSLWGLELWPHG
jgi:hypothetical protein